MNALHNHGYYNMHGMYGSGEPLSSPSNSVDGGWRTLNSSAAYTQPVGTLGSFDPTVGQVGGVSFSILLSLQRYMLVYYNVT